MRTDEDRLSDILNAIECIERYLGRGRAAFESDELIQVWMVHYLQVIGEAASSLSSSLKETYADIPWPSIIGFRNLVVHEYFRIDLGAVWAIVYDDLPVLKSQVEAILSSESDSFS